MLGEQTETTPPPAPLSTQRHSYFIYNSNFFLIHLFFLLDIRSFLADGDKVGVDLHGR